MTHALLIFRDEIEKTHPGLGWPCVLVLAAAKARKCVLIVAPPGCGKSTITDVVGQHIEPMLEQDFLTINGMGEAAEYFSNFGGLVKVDDLGKENNEYSRHATVTLLAELCYRGSWHKHTHAVHVDIENFHGAAVMNIQPGVLRRLVSTIEWESNISDKVLRYYHLQRPTQAVQSLPETTALPQIALEEVEWTSPAETILAKVYRLGLTQWGKTRVPVHTQDIVRAVAALDGSTQVRDIDAAIAAQALVPLQVERWCISRAGFETPMKLDVALLYFLTEFHSKATVSLQEFADNYKLTRTVFQKLLPQYAAFWAPTSKPVPGLVPSKFVSSILAGLERGEIIDAETIRTATQRVPKRQARRKEKSIQSA